MNASPPPPFSNTFYMFVTITYFQILKNLYSLLPITINDFNNAINKIDVTVNVGNILINYR